jgi:hypothetical protein
MKIVTDEVVERVKIDACKKIIFVVVKFFLNMHV